MMGWKPQLNARWLRKKVRVYKNPSIIGEFKDTDNLAYNSWSLSLWRQIILQKKKYILSSEED